LNLNLIDDGRLQRFLGTLGIAEEQRGHLIDTLRDFTDADKLHRLNGAEDEEYLAQGLPLPANRNLISPWEAQRIIGWRNAPTLWQNGRLVELSTTSLSVGLNPNTAPIEVLTTLPGVTEKIAKIIIARRKLSPITTEAQIVEITGMSLNQPFGMGVIATPSDSIRITQSSPGLSWAIQYNLTLTPNANDAPWRTDYYNRINTRQNNEAGILKLPPRSNVPPDKAPTFISGSL
jgi:DNA uptake protein ComE-like DNA-binding protein